MQSKIKIGEHPVHPIFVAFPVTFYTAAFIAYGAAYLGARDPMWFKVGIIANVVGVVSALAAAIPGFIDWIFVIPGKTKAKRIGLFHLGFNVAALVLFAVCLLLQVGRWGEMV